MPKQMPKQTQNFVAYTRASRGIAKTVTYSSSLSYVKKENNKFYVVKRRKYVKREKIVEKKLSR